jgi:Spy/CpxP family protein refolding chaperone
VVLAVLGAAALLIAAALAATRARGCDPAPAAAWRHAWQEAGYRAGGTWADFEDWFRSV